jgi:hypothetical protein
MPATPTATSTSIASSCPCTIWPSDAGPVTAANPDTAAVELGVKLQTDVSGFISGIRFYKGTGNTGTHIGTLWTSTGTPLAAATFTAETATGWQQVNLASPVAVTANTTYVASYHTNVGHYSSDQQGLSGAIDSPPLHALASGSSGGDGVYMYGATSAFPNNTFNATNYWVDVVFSLTATLPSPTATPTATLTPTPGPTGVGCQCSLNLNAGGAYAEAPDVSKLNVTADWTVELWIKDETPGGYNHNTSYILIKGDTNTDGEAAYLLGVGWNQLFVGERTGWNNQTLSFDLAASSISTGAWHHVAASMQASTRQLTVYLDGVQVLQGPLAAISSVGSSRPLSIGRDGTAGQNWQGKLDDLRIWNVVRTPAQISSNYRTEFGTAPSGLVANWKFDEGSGTLAGDSTPLPDAAALNSGAAWSTDVHP